MESHHAISGLVLRRRHAVEGNDGGNSSTVVIVGEVGNAIVPAHEHISHLDLRAGRADNCARIEMIHRRIDEPVQRFGTTSTQVKVADVFVGGNDSVTYLAYDHDGTGISAIITLDGVSASQYKTANGMV